MGSLLQKGGGSDEKIPRKIPPGRQITPAEDEQGAIRAADERGEYYYDARESLCRGPDKHVT